MTKGNNSAVHQILSPTLWPVLQSSFHGLEQFTQVYTQRGYSLLWERKGSEFENRNAGFQFCLCLCGLVKSPNFISLICLIHIRSKNDKIFLSGSLLFQSTHAQKIALNNQAFYFFDWLGYLRKKKAQVQRQSHYNIYHVNKTSYQIVTCIIHSKNIFIK